MRNPIFLVLLSLGLAGCGDGEESAESRAANASLLDQATVDALLGANVAPVEQGAPGNDSENGAPGNAADTSANGTD